MDVKKSGREQSGRRNLRPADSADGRALARMSGCPLFIELADCVDDLVFTFDDDLRIVSGNRGAATFFGYAREELVGKPLSVLIDAGERRRMRNLARTAKERRTGETVFLTKSYRKARLRFSLSPVAGPRNEPTGFLLVARPEAGGSRASASDRPDRLMERILDGIAEPAFIIDFPSRTISDCNEPAVSVTGFTRGELIGRRLFDHASDDEERVRFDALLAKADEAYAKTGIFWERTPLPRKKGIPLPCDCISLPVFGNDGSQIRSIAMFFDRSRMEEQEAALADLACRVKEFSSDLGTIAASFADRAKATRLSTLGFTRRQIEIARLVVHGASSKEIGFRLGITESTVKNHLSAMFRKVGSSSRIDFIHTLIARRIRIA